MRFLNADPIGFSGGLNWFAYADGNPISVLDPSGYSGWVLPSQLNQDPEFTRGYWQGAGAAVPAGVGLATLPFTGPVVGGALLSAGINTTSQLAEQHVNPEAQFSGASFAVDTGIGAAIPYGMGKAVPYAAQQLSRPLKGKIGESLSYINGIAQGRGLPSAAQQQISVAGRRPIPDYTYSSAGGTIYVEAKFGTSGLTSAQRAAANALGNSWITEYWTYGWIQSTSGSVGALLGGANAAFSFNSSK